MKTKDIAKQYNLDLGLFETFCRSHSSLSGIVYGSFSNTIPDEKVKPTVEAFKQDQLQREKAQIIQTEEKAKIYERKNRDEIKKNNAMASMLITSGFSFDGYTITKYSGYISGDDATQIPRSGAFGGNNGKNLTDALVRIRIQAIKELKEAAYDLGCNAVIGVDFDYITLEPETANINGGTLYEPYIICVTANGNAVVIEKNTNESN